jgi:RNA polymerase sigma-70 factor (ECF subfamily)
VTAGLPTAFDRRAALKPMATKNTASSERTPNPQADAQQRFIAEHMRRIFLLIYRLVRNIEDAQDLTQEAFIKALQRGDQLKELDKAGHWMSRIASNTAIDFLRRNGRISLSEIDEMPERFSSHGEHPEKLALERERRGAMDQALDILTDRERSALVMRDVEDLPAEEVAAILGCSKATVRSHIANARIKLRRYFAETGMPGERV